MIDLTTEEKRALAGLRHVLGYSLLVKMLKSELETILDRLRHAKDDYELRDAGHAFRAFDRVISLVESAPRELEKELKEEGDVVYG